MKILIVSQYYDPEQFQINEIAPELVRRGHQVTVLTGLPNYPKGEIFEGYRNGEKREESIRGVRVIRVPLHPRKHGPVHLLWNYVSFCWNACRRARRLREKFDLVFCYQLSPVTMALPAITYARKHHVPLLLYCLDIWPESARAHVKSDRGLFYGYLSRLSGRIYRQCDHIAVTSRPFIDYLNRVHGVPVERMSYIPQHADDRYLALDLHGDDNGIFDFMYAGNLGQGQKVDILIRAVAELKHRNDFILHLVGDGSCQEQLAHLAIELGVQDKVIFHGNQKRSDMPGFYRKADALLISLRGNNFVGNTLPGKLQAYMTTGKPIFGAINGAAEVIEEAQCGRCAPAGDYKGLAAILVDYMDAPEKYAHCGAGGRAYFQAHFALEQYMKLLTRQFETLQKGTTV